MNQRDLSCSVIVFLSAVFMQTITCTATYVYIWLNLNCPSLYDTVCRRRPHAPPLYFILYYLNMIMFFISCFYCSTNIQNGHVLYKKRADCLLFFFKNALICVATFLTFVFATINFYVEHYVNVVCVVSFWATVSYY